MEATWEREEKGVKQGRGKGVKCNAILYRKGKNVVVWHLPLQITEQRKRNLQYGNFQLVSFMEIRI